MSLIPFQFESRQIRTIDLDGQPMFSARDVALVLGYADPSYAYKTHCKSLKLLSSEESSELGWTNPNPRGEYVMPESDVFRLIVKSEKPEAERFERWLYDEVLPSIRKTGSYSLNTKPVRNDIPIVARLYAAEAYADLRRLAPSARLQLLNAVMCQDELLAKLPLVGYAVDAPLLTDESAKPTAAVTTLLRLHKITRSVFFVNALLEKHGFVETLERPSTSSPSGKKTFKSVTVKGMAFGKNFISSENSRETQPHYYRETFMDLMAAIGLTATA